MNEIRPYRSTVQIKRSSGKIFILPKNFKNRINVRNSEKCQKKAENASIKKKT